MNYDEFLAALASNADDEYRDFVKKGVLTKRPILGVRVPKVRELAKQVNADEALNHEPVSHEEMLALGFVIARLPYAEMKSRLQDFVRQIDNWEVCDTFCASLRRTILPRGTSARVAASNSQTSARVTASNFHASARVAVPNSRDYREDFLETLDEFLASSREFDLRFSLVCLLDFYVEPDYLPVIFDRILRVKNRDEYYVKMAIAWLIATCFTRFPEPTESFLLSADLPNWTFNKAISKICDSYRVEESTKVRLRELRRTTA